MERAGCAQNSNKTRCLENERMIVGRGDERLFHPLISDHDDLLGLQIAGQMPAPSAALKILL